MHHAVREDRAWFQNHPGVLIRFRTASPGEFIPLYAMGEQPPFFRPSVCQPSAPLRWVAVIDLMRLAGHPLSDSAEQTARLRLRIPAIRSFKRQEAAKAELLDLIAAELLETLELEETALTA